MYVDPNFPTKKALKDAVKAGKDVTVFQPGGFFPAPDGPIQYVEGPHYPRPHTWYATVELDDDGYVRKVS